MKNIIISDSLIKYKISSGLAVLMMFICFQQCGPSSAGKDGSRIDPGFGAYISGYTGGVISVASSIHIQLAQASNRFTQAGDELHEKIFDFSPSIEGKSQWVDQNTIEFLPASWLKPGTSYEARLFLDKLLAVPEEFRTMTYHFSTIKQNFSVDIEGISAADRSDLTKQKVMGILLTADAAESQGVEKMLAADQNGSPLKLEWEHNENLKSHRFTVLDVIRSEKASEIEIRWNGAPINVNETSSVKVAIPSLGDFKVMSARVVHFPQQYVALQFSDPLLDKQDLTGLISLADAGTPDFIIEGNVIRVYPPVSQTGNKKLIISKGIKNILGYKLANDQKIEVAFEQIKPGVRLSGKGVILPSTQGLIFPFESVNLKSVDVSITRIFENNIPQFLQVNDLNGTYEMKRVGYPVARKVVSLLNSGVTDPGKWNRFTLDLSSYMKSDPGSIYQVQIGFRQSYSTYYCEGAVSNDDNQKLTGENEDWNVQGNEISYWDTYEEDYYYPEGYNWDERENPCNVSYYTRDRFIVSNLLASDLGLMAKAGHDGNFIVVVTDLKNTEPQSGVTIDLYDYQKQLIQSAVSDNKGLASFKTERKPFLLIATRNTEKGYLKLDDGNSLSLSNFNVGGEEVQKGIKGFIYGERGVWRPGDSIHLAFMLEDKNRLLPDNHPVILELFNPQGQLNHKIVRTASVRGIYDFSTVTPDDAPTGNWLAKISVGGAEFTKQVKIETIKPNRLKISLDFSTDHLASGGESVGDLSVKWLHGAIAAHLKAEFEVTLQKAATSFPEYPDYTFDDISRSFSPETFSVFEGSLDGDGKARVPVNLSLESAAPGMLNASFKGRVFEESGDFSVDQFSIPYYPYQSFVGILTPRGDRARGMLLTDTTHQVSIVTINPEGKGISRSGVDVEIYKLDWRWWWDSSDNNLGNFISSNYHNPVSRQKINTINGKGRASFRINYPEWGRYLIRASDPVSGHSASKIIYVDWPGWAGRGQKEMPGGATMLSFTSDKESYQTGETVRLSIPGSGQGRAFISVENGSRILENYWLETRKGENIFNISVKEDFSPNVFVFVTLLQPHDQAVNDLPIRLYGILPVKVDNPETHLKPVISMNEELKPESLTEVRISEASGKAMAYTVAVVDEGLLDLTNYKTPDPWEEFYKREGLGVRTWDLFDEVIGAYGGNLERLLSIGGDQDIKRPEGSKANRFKPVVIYMGPFYLEKGKTAIHKFKMPAYIGAVRTMVVAGNAGSYGIAEKETPVRQPLMILATLPRVLGPDEEVSLPVTVFSYDPKVKEAEVNVKTNNLIEIRGESSQLLTINQPGDQVINFNLKVTRNSGVGIVEVNARSGAVKSSDRIEIAIRNPNPPAVKVYESIVEAGKDWQISYKNIGTPGTNNAVLEISSIPPIDLKRRLNYLVQYPYGCVEQTISSVFPQLYLQDITELTSEMKNQVDVNIKAGIQRMLTFQNSDGGFKYWPDAYYADEWSSSYAGHFLLEAKRKGYNISESMLRDWKKYQKREADAWTKTKYRNSTLLQAYRLYTLALADEAMAGNMNRLREIDMPVAAKWRLAAAYQLAGMADVAAEITSNISKTPDEYKELTNSYGSTLRDEAMILEALVLMNKRSEGMDLMKKISAGLSDYGRWMSTQETAFALIAVSAFSSKGERTSGIRFDYTWNNNNKISASSGLPVIQKALQTGDELSETLKIYNAGQGMLYARLIQDGIPAIAEETESSNSLSMIVTYKDAKGNPVELSRLNQGTELVAEVSVNNPGLRGEYSELALTQVFPSGFEIVNERLAEDAAGSNVNPDKPGYQDIRDDRVYTFFDLSANKRKLFRVKLIATYAGRYYLPGTFCEAMYDNSINARTKGRWIEISQSETQ
jgi:uncharacterized protein YfaS (alpha-2-macroglobulin family)